MTAAIEPEMINSSTPTAYHVMEPEFPLFSRANLIGYQFSLELRPWIRVSVEFLHVSNLRRAKEYQSTSKPKIKVMGERSKSPTSTSLLLFFD